MRTKYTIINVIVNIGGQLLTAVLTFISRMIFIRYLSVSYLGVNGLFTDVLGILNFTELGIGTAMIFSLYEPAARNDEKKLGRLMNLYKWMYRVVAVAVLSFGLILLPFLPILIDGSKEIKNIQLIYLLYVTNSASSYLLNYKNSIYQAYQKSYVRATYGMICEIVRVLIQILVLVLTGSFILYLVVQFIVQFIPNILISRRADKEFPYLKTCKELPEESERKDILKNIGAMSIHKLATVIVNNTDSLLMSSYIGLATVGMYSNYRLVLINIQRLIEKVGTAFTGSVGNLSALEEPERIYKIYREMDFIFFVITAYCAGGMYMLINPFIAIFFGKQYCFTMMTVTIIIVSFFITGLRRVNLMFREAMGLFWNDRYKAIAESVINLVVSLILVQKYGVAGIIGGTVISTLSTCTWMEPYILMKYGIQDNWKPKLKRYFVNYVERCVLTVVISGIATYWVYRFPVDNVAFFILDGGLYTILFVVVIVIVYRKNSEYQSLKNRILSIIHKKK
ncbi:lipopolysaccharide biosynthesis protein [Brotaphodocola sp.]|uniref:lipopolysaccharide biosynthesis protein n=1 Tax=Brotaphodocola sp. TaxID=3073577 RepID=UPI003D7D1521